MSTTDTKKRRVIVGNRNVSETMTGCEVTSTKHTNYVSPLKRKIKRVFLIQPPAMTNLLRTDMNPNVPLGICYIGAMLERDGYEVAICDAFIEGWETEVPVSEDRMRVGLTYEEIEQKIRDFDPQVVGITSMFTMQRTIAHKMAEIARKIDPKIITIMGGAHPTSAPEMVMEDPDVDFIVLAEGDNAITPLLKTIENGGNLVDLDGICFRDDDAEMIYLKKTTLVNDLDSLPFPARHLVPMEKYFAAGVRHGGYSRGERSTSIISSRGCQYLCNFCTAFKVFTRTPRLRSADNVLAEMRHLKEEYGVDEIFFEDDQLLAKRDRAIELFDAMASELKILFDTPNGISQWLLTEDIIRRMKAAGCYRINLALESGNQWVLDNIIIKPVKIDMVPETVRLIRKYDMDVGMFIVAGNIAWDTVETFEQLADSFKLARKINIRPHVSYLTGYPGSQVLEIAQKKGWLVDNFTWEDLCIHRQQIRSDEWTCEELSEFVERQQTLCFLNYVLKNPLKTAVNISTSLKHNGPTYIASRFKDWGFRIFADVLKDENGRQRFVPKFLMNDANVRTG